MLKCKAYLDGQPEEKASLKTHDKKGREREREKEWKGKEMEREGMACWGEGMTVESGN